MSELLGEDDGVYGEGLVLVDIFRPVDFHHLVVHVVGTTGAEVADRLENTDGGVQLEIGAVHEFLVASE